MRATRLPTTLAVGAAALLSLLTACGGSAKTSSPNRTPAPLTAEKGQALATAAVLTGADMPGFTPKKQTHDASDVASENRITSCLGRGTPTYLARDFGTSFTRGRLEVDSSADVAQGSAAARADLAAITGSKAKGCLETEFGSLLSTSGATLTSFSLTPETIVVPGSAAAFAFKIAIAGTAGGQRLNIRGYQVGCLVGQVEIDVDVIDFSGSAAFTLDQAVALLKTVTDRTKAAAT